MFAVNVSRKNEGDDGRMKEKKITSRNSRDDGKNAKWLVCVDDEGKVCQVN
jgi:hypothetical protein